MWSSPRGRDYARDFAFERVSLPYVMRIQMCLTVSSIMAVSAFHGSMTAEEDAVIWPMLEGLYDAWAQGKIKEEDYFGMVTTWLGVSNKFGWNGVAGKFPRELRGPLAYCMGNRYMVLGKRDKSKEFFQGALADVETNPKLATLVQDRIKQFGLK
jgi:hypothetical protein